MLVRRRSLHRNLLGFPNNLPVPIYTSGWRDTVGVSVLPKNTTQHPWPGLEPGPLKYCISQVTKALVFEGKSTLPLSYLWI